MAHYGLLRDYHFTDDVDDIRGSSLYGPGDEKLGKIDDVIFDHATGHVQYLVVDTGGWLSSKKFLVPADRVHAYAQDEDDFATDMTRQQIEALPRYDENMVATDQDWNDYDKRYRESLESGPVMHKENSTHMITPEASEMPAPRGSGVDDSAFTPDRLAGKFPEASPDPSKLRIRPASASRAEDARQPGTFVGQDKPTLAGEEAADRAAANPREAQRDHLTAPDQVYNSELTRHRRWAAFEDHLRRNRVDITAACRNCGAGRDKVA